MPAARSDTANAVKDNVDFISFNFDDDDDKSDTSEDLHQPPPNAPTGPSGDRNYHSTHLHYDGRAISSNVSC